MSIIIDPNIQSTSLSINASSFGGATPNGVGSTLMEIKYSFPAFNQPNLSTFAKGDVVAFSDSEIIGNIYNSKLEKANSDDLVFASKMLFIFIKYSNNTLVVMHKGYIDYEQDAPNIDQWKVGQTIYLNEDKVSIAPSTNSGAFVKSIGFCMPNNENKKRIWFEPDSTYLTLQ